MRKPQLHALCFGLFLFAALPISKAGLLIDSFGFPGSPETLTVTGPSKYLALSPPDVILLDGHVTTRVTTVATSSEVTGSASTDIGGGTAFFGSEAGKGTTTHEITWTMTRLNLLGASGATSMETLSFVLAVIPSSTQPFLIKVWSDVGLDKWASYGATVSTTGNANLNYTGANNGPDLTQVKQITFETLSLPAGGSFQFDQLDAVPLTAVPEPANVAMGVFGGLALAVGGVRVGRRLMIVRRTA
jgi:hypothetical protein